MGISASPGVLPVRISGPFFFLLACLDRSCWVTYGVESDSDRTAGESIVFGRLTDVVDDRLVVLRGVSFVSRVKCGHLPHKSRERSSCGQR
jgi:hypothetical protein